MPLKDLWRLGRMAGGRQCQGCSRCCTRGYVKKVRQPCLDIDSGQFAAAAAVAEGLVLRSVSAGRRA